MRLHDNFDVWANDPYTPSLRFKVLSDEDIEYWAGRNRWLLLDAIYLSMGFNPRAKQKTSGKLLDWPIPEEAQVTEFFKRIKTADTACKNGSLFSYKVAAADTGYGPAADRKLERYEQIYNVDREVDVKTFIDWATDKIKPIHEPLFILSLKYYKSIPHSIAGKEGSKPKRKLLDRIKELAYLELDSGCLCQHHELAGFLQNLKRGDGSYAILEVRKTRKGKQPEIEIFLEAVTECFNERGLLRSHEKKEPGKERGKKLCNLHRNLT